MSGPDGETGSLGSTPPADYELRKGVEFLAADEGAAPDVEPEEKADPEPDAEE
jgi:isocitrate/isopropylmalate dehydrogenase